MICAREFNRVRTLPASSVTFTRLTAGMTDSAVFVVRHRAGKWICAVKVCGYEMAQRRAVSSVCAMYGTVCCQS